MRGSVMAVGLAVVLGGAWWGGQHVAATRLTALIDADPALQAADVRALRDPRRFGLRITDARWSDPVLDVTMRSLDLAVSPLAPLTLRAVPAADLQVVRAGQTMDLTLTQPQVRLSVVPGGGVTAGDLALSSGPALLDGAPLAAALSLQADRSDPGTDAPAGSVVRYDLDLALDDLDARGLARLGLDPGPLPGPLGLRGPMQLWLDRAPSLTGGDAPQVIGWQSPGLTLQAGQIGLRLAGRVTRDAEGRAEGQVALYSRDADALIDLAAGLGLIPDQARLLLRAGLAQMAQAEIDDSLPGPVLPPPGDGELRLPVIFRGGTLVLGGLPIGPAPRF